MPLIEFMYNTLLFNLGCDKISQIQIKGGDTYYPYYLLSFQPVFWHGVTCRPNVQDAQKPNSTNTLVQGRMKETCETV